MSAKDKFHDVVKKSLIKEGWHITNDPLFLSIGGVDMFIDLGAERLIGAEKEGEKIAVEIKSFLNSSATTDFHLAVGQFINYQAALTIKDFQRQLFLAVPSITYEYFFQREFVQFIIQTYQIKLLVYNIEEEVVIKWIK